MPLVVLQCFDCYFYPTLKSSYEESFEGKFTCKQFVDGIPKTVEDGSEDCPKFKDK